MSEKMPDLDALLRFAPTRSVEEMIRDQRAEEAANPDNTALSHWFPKIAAAGLPVPKTKIIDMSADAEAEAWQIFDGKEPGDLSPVAEKFPALEAFASDLKTAAAALGVPCFLRTDHTSGKHEWDRTCFVRDAAKIRDHALAIAYFSECVSAGPWRRWVVRELLPTVPFGLCPGYGNMPVCREFRFFVDDGRVRCWHPYWPGHALEDGGADGLDYGALCELEPIELGVLKSLAEQAGAAVGGSWSVDLLETRRGWYLTDMAEARKSFHWEGCAR